MLKISIMRGANELSVNVEGRLVGPWVDELQSICEGQGLHSTKLTIDLCGLTAMDLKGQQCLEGLLQRGATLLCSDVMNQYLVEQMANTSGQAEESCRPCRRAPNRSERRDMPGVPLASSEAG